jgi:hypothetical protein
MAPLLATATVSPILSFTPTRGVVQAGMGVQFAPSPSGGMQMEALRSLLQLGLGRHSIVLRDDGMTKRRHIYYLLYISCLNMSVNKYILTASQNRKHDIKDSPLHERVFLARCLPAPCRRLLYVSITSCSSDQTRLYTPCIIWSANCPIDSYTMRRLFSRKSLEDDIHFISTDLSSTLSSRVSGSKRRALAEFLPSRIVKHICVHPHS